MTSSDGPRPAGLVYRPELLAAAEERALLVRLDALRFDPIVMHGREARRTARHFGLDYDYGARAPKPGEPMPGWLVPVRIRAAELAAVGLEQLAEILVQRYPPGSTIGWHRDAPAFEKVVGVSLGGACRLRLQRGTGPRRHVYEIALEARCGYVLTGEARSSWQHSIPPTKELRYSITFRTLRTSDRVC